MEGGGVLCCPDTSYTGFGQTTGAGSSPCWSGGRLPRVTAVRLMYHSEVVSAIAHWTIIVHDGRR
jgi:hypothetical protein